MSEASAVETADTITPTEEAPQLQIGDIEAAVKVIDYAAEQGAFKGWQVVQEVLVLRNRLVQFVRAVQPETEPTTDDVPESPAAE